MVGREGDAFLVINSSAFVEGFSGAGNRFSIDREEGQGVNQRWDNGVFWDSFVELFGINSLLNNNNRRCHHFTVRLQSAYPIDVGERQCSACSPGSRHYPLALGQHLHQKSFIHSPRLNEEAIHVHYLSHLGKNKTSPTQHPVHNCYSLDLL